MYYFSNFDQWGRFSVITFYVLPVDPPHYVIDARSASRP